MGLQLMQRREESMLGRVIGVQEESVRGRQDRVQAMVPEMTLEKYLVMQTVR
jgi:hypothetical protein